jgi:hypothetical protein
MLLALFKVPTYHVVFIGHKQHAWNPHVWASRDNPAIPHPCSYSPIGQLRSSHR